MRVLLVFAERRGLPTPHDAPRTTKTTQPTTSSECPSRRKIGLEDGHESRHRRRDRRAAPRRETPTFKPAYSRAPPRSYADRRVRTRRESQTRSSTRRGSIYATPAEKSEACTTAICTRTPSSLMPDNRASGLYLLGPNVLVGKNCYERPHLIGEMSQHRQRAPPEAQSKDDSLQRYIRSR